MSEITRLSGWNINVSRKTFKQAADNGKETEIDGYQFIFTEMRPPTGNKIIWEFASDVKDYIVGELTGIALPGLGDVPRL